MLTYLINTTIIWTAALLLFDSAFSKLPMHRENRLYLLLTLAMGLILPLMPLHLGKAKIPEVIQQTVQQTTAIRERVASGATTNATGHSRVVSIIAIGYAIGVVISLIMLLRGAWTLISLYRTGRRLKRDKYTVIYTTADHLPFSFFRFIFIAACTEYNADELAIITRHELRHASLLHSLDVLLVLLLRVVLWFHPLIHLYYNRLRLVHEFQADAVEGDNLEAYGHFLLEQNFLANVPVLAHSITFSPLKTRLSMLLRSQTVTVNRFRYAFALMLLPIFFITCATAATKKGRVQRGDKIYFNSHVIGLGGGLIDTTTVIDPNTKETKLVVTKMDSFPALLDGQKIYQEGELNAKPSFIGTENDAAMYLFNKLQPMLNQLNDGIYQINIEDPIINDNGKLVYYNVVGIRMVFRNPVTDDKGNVFGYVYDETPVDYSASPSKKGPKPPRQPIMDEINQRTEDLLANIQFKAGVVDGRPVPVIIPDDLDLKSERRIVVKDHKATLTFRKAAVVK